MDTIGAGGGSIIAVISIETNPANGGRVTGTVPASCPACRDPGLGAVRIVASEAAEQVIPNAISAAAGAGCAAGLCHVGKATQSGPASPCWTHRPGSWFRKEGFPSGSYLTHWAVPMAAPRRSRGRDREPMKSDSQAGGTPWKYRADILTPCNCDWGCPCSFNQPPTYGFCQGSWILRLREGSAGAIDLSNQSFAYIGSWPKALHFGGGTAKLLIEEKATSEQRSALEGIVRGKLGGKPWPLIGRTVDHWLPTSFVPFEWKLEGSRSSVTAGTELKAVLTPMRNPVTGNEVAARIVLPEGVLTREENVTSTQTFSVFAEGLKYAWPGRNAWYGTVEHGT